MTFAPMVIERPKGRFRFHRRLPADRPPPAGRLRDAGLALPGHDPCAFLFHPPEEGAGISAGVPMFSERERELVESQIIHHLESVFGPGTVDSNLPELVQQTIAWIICELYPALLPDTRRNIRPAVAFLYPANKHYPFDPTQEPPAEAAPPSWKRIAALLQFWALFVSNDAQASFCAVCHGDLSEVDKVIRDYGFDACCDDRARLAEINSTFELLHQAWDNVLRAKVAAPIIHLGRREITALAKQWENTNPDLEGYDLLYRLNLSIDPYHDLESTLAAVRQAVESCHADLSRSHAADWNDEERLFYGDEYIDGLDPVKGFTYKGRGDKSRKVQSFTGEAAESLLVFALRQTMTPTEINEKFFPLWPPDTDAATRPKAKRNTDRYNLAVRLIRNARSGVAMQS